MADLKPGARVRLVEMPKDPCPVEVGVEGTVEKVVDVFGSTQIWMMWDDGRQLAMIVPPDRYEVIG